MVGERWYGNPNGHVLQTRGGPGPPRRGASISSLSEGSGYYIGGPVSSGRSGVPTACARVPAFSGTRGVSGPFPTEERPRPLLGEQDSGPQGSGCLDVVKDNL